MVDRHVPIGYLMNTCALASSEHLEEQSRQTAEVAERLEYLTAYGYDWRQASGGVPHDQMYCPMTRLECMGKNCAATKEVGGMWRCTAFGSCLGAVVEWGEWRAKR